MKVHWLSLSQVYNTFFDRILFLILTAFSDGILHFSLFVSFLVYFFVFLRTRYIHLLRCMRSIRGAKNARAFIYTS